MRAARYHGKGPKLRIETIVDPKPIEGSAVVRVLATFVSPSTKAILADPGGYPLPPVPFTPGMSVVGEIESIGAGVKGLEPGARVYCDPYIASRNVSAPPDGAFIGYFGFTPAAASVLARWPDGGFAEKAVFPAECLTPLALAGHAVEPAILARLGHLGTAHEALRRGGFAPGRTVLVTGATGVLGEPGHLGDDARSSGVGLVQPLELADEGRVDGRLAPDLLELLEGRNEGLGDIPPPKRAEAPDPSHGRVLGHRHSSRDASRAASMNCRTASDGAPPVTRASPTSTARAPART